MVNVKNKISAGICIDLLLHSQFKHLCKQKYVQHSVHSTIKGLWSLYFLKCACYNIELPIQKSMKLRHTHTHTYQRDWGTLSSHVTFPVVVCLSLRSLPHKRNLLALDLWCNWHCKIPVVTRQSVHRSRWCWCWYDQAVPQLRWSLSLPSWHYSKWFWAMAHRMRHKWVSGDRLMCAQVGQALSQSLLAPSLQSQKHSTQWANVLKIARDHICVQYGKQRKIRPSILIRLDIARCHYDFYHLFYRKQRRLLWRV